MKNKCLKWNSRLLLFISPLVRKKIWGKNLKIWPLIMLTACPPFGALCVNVWPRFFQCKHFCPLTRAIHIFECLLIRASTVLQILIWQIRILNLPFLETNKELQCFLATSIVKGFVLTNNFLSVEHKWLFETTNLLKKNEITSQTYLSRHLPIFILNFEHISHIVLVFLFVNFEHAIAALVNIGKYRILSFNKHWLTSELLKCKQHLIIQEVTKN